MTHRLFGPRTFLLGPHGSGKSSVGRALISHGYEHISVGALARMARRNLRPSNIPSRLMILLARHVPGTPLHENTVEILVDHIRSRPRIVVDGFPGAVDHLASTEVIKDISFVYVYAPRPTRESRLTQRATITARHWEPGRKSERDLALPALCNALRNRGSLGFFNNANTAVPLVIPAELVVFDESRPRVTQAR